MQTPKPLHTLRFINGRLELLDQTRLPAREIYESFDTPQGVAGAIREMKVRGAPAIGVAAAYGMLCAVTGAPEKEIDAALVQAASILKAARPTAVNLAWAVERMLAAAETAKKKAVPVRALLEREARAIEQEDLRINRAIGENLLSLLGDGQTILTHCNAGALATTGLGTALSPLYLAQEKGMRLRAYADETRPRLQGARLTAYELARAGIDVTLICDNMAPVVMREGKIDAVITGCDRVAANGDTANKIGTFGLSIMAKHFGIPFYIAAPTPTIDLACAHGGAIPIEQRDADEIRVIGGEAVAPLCAQVYNPSFDVTPAEHITAIVTEKGVVRPPFAQGLQKLFV